MAQPNKTKINQLLSNWPDYSVMTSEWLSANGYPPDLMSQYRKGGWVESVGRGAWKKEGEAINWKGGLYALQSQLGLKVHVASVSALALQGHSHYVTLSDECVYLLGEPSKLLPAWFREYEWGVSIDYRTTRMFSKENSLGLKTWEEDEFLIQIASSERAILELLQLVPKDLSFEFAEQHMEGLLTLRPQLLENLLTVCSSIKVKRLFLYLAEHLEMPWFNKIDIGNLDLGKGKRTIVKGGSFNKKYQITVPKREEADDE